MCPSGQAILIFLCQNTLPLFFGFQTVTVTKPCSDVLVNLAKFLITYDQNEMCIRFKAVIQNCCFISLVSILNLSHSLPIQQVSKRKLQLLAWQENLLALSSPVFSKWGFLHFIHLVFYCTVYQTWVFRSFHTQTG